MLLVELFGRTTNLTARQVTANEMCLAASIAGPAAAILGHQTDDLGKRLLLSAAAALAVVAIIAFGRIRHPLTADRSVIRLWRGWVARSVPIILTPLLFTVGPRLDALILALIAAPVISAVAVVEGRFIRSLN